MNKLLKIQEPLADTYPDAYKTIVLFLCKCWKLRNYQMFCIFNKKRKFFLQRLK